MKPGTLYKSLINRTLEPTTEKISVDAFIALAQTQNVDSAVKRNELIVYFLNTLPDAVIANFPKEIGDISDSNDGKFNGILKDLIFDGSLSQQQRNDAASILCSWTANDKITGSATPEEVERKQLSSISTIRLLHALANQNFEFSFGFEEYKGVGILKQLIEGRPPSAPPSVDASGKFVKLSIDEPASDSVRRKAAFALKGLALDKNVDALEPLADLYFAGDYIPMNYIEGFKWLIIAQYSLPKDSKKNIKDKIDMYFKKHGSDSLLKAMDEVKKLFESWSNSSSPLTPPPLLSPD